MASRVTEEQVQLPQFTGRCVKSPDLLSSHRVFLTVCIRRPFRGSVTKCKMGMYARAGE